jgi:cobalt-zinc-cadmium efflux system membrane fusion protein
VSIACVFVLLGALLAWGHFSDWKLPKFSSLVGADSAPAAPWCPAHNVPEASCMECHPGLAPGGKSFDWCKEHGIPDCPLEHPEIAQTTVPPVVTAEDLRRAKTALATRPRAENNSRCKSQAHHVQFASAEALEKAGVDVAVVEQRPLVEAIVANGEVDYDQNLVAHLSSRAAGTVWRVEKNVGERVRPGDVLALVDAMEVGRTKAEFLQALTQRNLQQANADRLAPLARDGTVPAKQLREVQTALEEAKTRLLSAQQALVNLGLPVEAKDFEGLGVEQIARRIQFLGLPSYFVATINPATATSNLLPVTAPIAGTVIERHVVAGEVVQPTSTLFTIADTATMWLVLSVRQDDAPDVKVGQPVRFQPSDATAGREVRGTVAWLSTAADERTRTISVRVELDNHDGTLRANTFGAGKIVLRDESQAVVVPSEAVHRDADNCRIVFVRDKNWFKKGEPKFFHVRKVRLGITEGDMTEVIAGLLPGEVVASRNSNLLEAQLLKSNLGDGCGCAH